MTKDNDKLADLTGDALAKLDAAAAIQARGESTILERVEQGYTLPADRAEQTKIAEALAQNVHNRWGKRLSPEDQAMWLLLKDRQEARVDPREAKRLREAYADFLIDDNAIFYGAVLLLVPEIAELYSAWVRSRPDLIRRFGEKLLARSRSLSGEKKSCFPITDEHREFKRAAVPELGRLFGRFRRQRTRTVHVGNRELAEWIEKEIEAHPRSWPVLLQQYRDIQSYVRDNKDREFAQTVLYSGMTPASFVDQWFATTRGITVPYAGQRLSSRRD